MSKHFRLFVTQTKTRRTVNKTKQSKTQKKAKAKDDVKTIQAGKGQGKLYQLEEGRKNNINSSRNYELQLFSCLGHFSSSFLPSVASQPTWLSTSTHTHTLTLFLCFSPLFLGLSLSHLAGQKEKTKSVAKEQKELANF